MKRQIRYNSIVSTENPEMLTWYFLIINDISKIPVIQRRICEQFSENSPLAIEERLAVLEGKTEEAGIRFKLISFDSPKNDFNKNKIYSRKKVIKDDRLYERSEKGKPSLETYILERFGKK